MSEPFVGEIRLFGFDYNPRYWLKCDGSTLPIQNYSALFALLGTSFGGNGSTTFQIPDLRGRAPIGAGTAPGRTPQTLGQTGGSPTATLSVDQIPSHNHVLNAGTLNPPNPPQNVPAPSPQALLGLSAPNNVYIDPVTPDTAFNPVSISPNTGDQPHANMQPYLAINFCIAWAGIFPARN